MSYSVTHRIGSAGASRRMYDDREVAIAEAAAKSAIFGGLWTVRDGDGKAISVWDSGRETSLPLA